MSVEAILGGLCTVGAIILLVTFGSYVRDTGFERECLNTGKTIVNGTLYACQKIGPSIKP